MITHNINYRRITLFQVIVMPLSPNADAGNKFIFNSKNLLCWVHCTAKEDYWKMCNWRKNPSADFTQQRDSFRYKLKALHLSNLMFWSGAHQKLFSDTYEHTLRQSSNGQLWERNMLLSNTFYHPWGKFHYHRHCFCNVYKITVLLSNFLGFTRFFG